MIYSRLPPFFFIYIKRIANTEKMIAFTFLKYFFILPVYTYNSDACMYKIIDSILDFQSLQYWKKIFYIVGNQPWLYLYISLLQIYKVKLFFRTNGSMTTLNIH